MGGWRLAVCTGWAACRYRCGFFAAIKERGLRIKREPRFFLLSTKGLHRLG
jgi:hypothetical protein